MSDTLTAPNGSSLPNPTQTQSQPQPESPSQSQPRILTVFGSTGVGKTKLAIELSHRFNAELISCDSIQVYDGLPIASNHCTDEEAQGSRHHMMAVVPPWKAMIVHGFRKAAKALIADIHRRGRNVIIVGGTFYWLESLLYQTFMTRNEKEDAEEKSTEEQIEVEEVETNVPDSLLQLLNDIKSELTDDTIESLPTPRLSAYATLLLAHRFKERSSYQSHINLLLRQLMRSTVHEWKQLLQNMGPNEVKRVPFVRSIIRPTLSSSPSQPSSSLAAPPSTLIDPSSSSSSPSFSSLHLFELLNLIDPVSASKLHPNNSRKILRSLEVYVELDGQTQSSAVSESGGMKGEGGLQYPFQAIWLDCDTATLNQRLDDRIDSMIHRGLIEEVEKMYMLLWRRQYQHQQSATEWSYLCTLDNDDCNICAEVESRDVLPILTQQPLTQSSSSSSNSSISPFIYLGPSELQFDWERGIGQALGLKEFRPYFKLKYHTSPEELSRRIQSIRDVRSHARQPAHKKQKISSTLSSDSFSSSTGEVTDSDIGATLLESCIRECLTSLKARTRNYAHVQSRWIKNRLWTTPNVDDRNDAASSSSSDASNSIAASSTDLSILRLDATRIDPQTWSNQISAPAIEVADAFFHNRAIHLNRYASFASNLPPIDPRSSLDSTSSIASSSSPVWVKNFCDSCNQLCNGPLEWSKHLQSRKHRTNQTRTSRKEKQMEQQKQIQAERQAKREAELRTKQQQQQQQEGKADRDQQSLGGSST